MVGAGVAGLACAVRLATLGRNATVYEAAGHGGGRCRSFHDKTLDRRIDNGSHLLLSGNHAVMAYLDEIGAPEGLTGPERAEFRFLDITDDVRWTLRPSRGAMPWWVFSKAGRIPGTSIRDYLSGWRIARAGPNATVRDCLDPDSQIYRRFWAPFAVSVLNTQPDEAAAHLLWPVLKETFGKGEAACRPRIAREGLSEAFVDPAVRFLEDKGCPVRLRARLRGLDFDGSRVAGLNFEGEAVPLAPDDAVVLAVPPQAARDLLPGLETPRESRSIANVHFRLPDSAPDIDFIGLVGGTAEWVFRRGDVASVTISAAETVAGESAETLASRVWPEVNKALSLALRDRPPHRVIKERRATFAQTPDEVARRPAAKGPWDNMFLAGDWTDTGLPATIEGAMRSGREAANLALQQTPS